MLPGFPLHGYLAHKTMPNPYEHQRTLCIGLLKGPRGVPFLVSAEPLYPIHRQAPISLRCCLPSGLWTVNLWVIEEIPM